MRRAAAIVLALALAALPAAAPLAQASRSPVPLLAPDLRLLPEAIPFELGEEVRYEINWKPLFLFPAFKAGEVRLTIEKTEYRQQEAYKISAWAVSDGLLKSVAGLDVRDYFESTIDGGSFKSQRFVQQTRQNTRQRDLEVVIDYPSSRAMVREFDVSADPPRQIRDEVRPDIPAAVSDTLSVFYAARLKKMKPGDEYLAQLSDNGKIVEVLLAVLGKESVRTQLGRFETVLISTRGGIFSQGGDFRIWYTQDGLRIPVKFEADVKFGKVYGQLIEVRTPRMTKGLIRIE